MVPWIDRPELLARLADALARTEAGDGGGIAILGPAGLGKSRLVDEWLARSGAVELHRWKASEAARREPGHGVAEAVRTAAGIRPDAPAFEARALLSTWCAGRFGREGTAAAHFVGEWVGLSFPDSRESRDPAVVAERASELLRRHFREVAPGGRRVVVIEEAQRCDGPSLAFFAALAERAPPGLLVVWTGRPELASRPELPALWPTLQVDPLPLGPLGAALGDEALAARSGGHPLHAVQLAAAAAEGVPLDGAVHELALHRLLHLPVAARVVAQLAAVAGARFWPGVVVDLLERESLTAWPGPDAVDEGLAALEASGWVRRGEPEWSFAHDLLRDVALESLPGWLRSRLHGHVARWLQRRVGDREREWLGTLGGHVEASDEPAAAAELYRRAAARAASTNAVREALRLYARALAVEGTRPGVRAEVRLEAARLRERVGEWERAHRELARASDEARSASDHALVARCMVVDADITLLEGHFDRAVAQARQAVGLARRAGARDVEAAAATTQASAAARQGRWEEAARFRSEVLAARVALGDRRGEAEALLGLASSQTRARDASGAVESYRRARALAGELGDLALAGSALHGLALVADHEGRYRDAIAAYGESLELRRAAGDRPRTAWNLHNLSHLHRRLGDAELAWSLHREEIAVSREVGNRPGVAYGRFTEGCLREHDGDLDGAARCYAESLSLFREVGEWPLVAALLVAVASLAHARGDREAALDLLDEATAQPILDEDLDDALQVRVQVELDHGSVEDAAEALRVLDEHHGRCPPPRTSAAWRDLFAARLAVRANDPSAGDALDRAVASGGDTEDVRPRLWAEALRASVGRGPGLPPGFAGEVERTASARLRSRVLPLVGLARVQAGASAEAAGLARPATGDQAAEADWAALADALRREGP